MKGIVYALLISVFIVIIVISAKREKPHPRLATSPPLSKPEKSRRSFADLSCAETYLQLYSKPVIDVRMIFGYKDARPARFVDDRYEEMIFIQRITGECRGAREDCGFLPAKTGPSAENVFTRTIEGPDGEVKTIRLTVVHSSVSPDDEANRKNPYQKWQTNYAKAAFIDALKNADVVFYNGHSRSGGGPDFAPPLIDGRGHVKYPLYKARATSLTAMEKALRESHRSHLQMLGLFSCASEQLFTKKLTSAKPGLGVISSRQLLYFSDALENSLLSLSALLEMKCRSDWSTLFETSTDLKGFWASEAGRATGLRSKRIKDHDQRY